MNVPYRRFENFHIFLWLIKDFCWISDQKLAGMIMVVPTLFMALFIAYKSQGNLTEFMHNLAVVCWITANSIWMFGEFYLNDTTRPYAMIFFILGLLIIGYHYLIGNPFWKRQTEA